MGKDVMFLTNKITGLLKQAAGNGDMAGANVLVLKNGNEAAYCESGMRDIENNIPMTRDTIFRLYSQTKPVTAAAVILLASQGKIDLSGWLSDYLHEFENMYVNNNGTRTPAEKHITAADLLNMTLLYP